MNFSDRLRELRGQRTQKEIAALLEVKASSYTNWENGREPTYATLIHIAKYFDVSVDYLIGAEERKPLEWEGFCEKCGLDRDNFRRLQLIKNRSYEGCNLIEAFNFLLRHLEFETLLETIACSKGITQLDTERNPYGRKLFVRGVQALVQDHLKNILEAWKEF